MEDMMASEGMEDKMASEGMEDMMVGEEVEDMMASEEVEDSQKLEDEVTSEEVKDEMGEIQVEDMDHNEEVKLPQAEHPICAKQNQESNAESLGSDIDAADDENDSYAEAENDIDCNSDTDENQDIASSHVTIGAVHQLPESQPAVGASVSSEDQSAQLDTAVDCEVSMEVIPETNVDQTEAVHPILTTNAQVDNEMDPRSDGSQDTDDWNAPSSSNSQDDSSESRVLNEVLHLLRSITYFRTKDPKAWKLIPPEEAEGNSRLFIQKARRKS
ncbi:hypothetical protein EMCRGX_G031377 [Ephydatia muelleri]